MLSGKNPLFIALALGILAGLIAYAGIKAKEKQVRQGWNTVRILVAAQDIAEGTEIDRDMVEAQPIPEKFITESFIRINDDGTPMRDVPWGQRVLVPLKKGDPVLTSHFEVQRDAEFSTMINEKGRAVTIEVQEKQSVGQWVHPNDHVDIVGTFRDAAANGELKTTTLMQNVLVLATGHINANTAFVPEEDKKYQTVTVMTLPEEAEMLALAQETGTLTLLLRNPDDLDYQEKRSVIDQKQLLAGDRSNELQKKRYNTIQIIRGNKNNDTGGAAAVAPAKTE